MTLVAGIFGCLFFKNVLKHHETGSLQVFLELITALEAGLKSMEAFTGRIVVSLIMYSNRWGSMLLKVRLMRLLNKWSAKIASGLALLFLGLTIVILLLWGIDFHIIKPTFQNLEEKQAVEDGNRVKSAIENEIGNIGNLAIDWARWDGTYIFAQDHNHHYIESNYSDPAFLSQNSNVDLFAIFDQKGRSLLQGNYHPDINQQIELDITSGSEPAILAILAPVFKNGKRIDGLLRTNHGIIILSAHPILSSKGQGPSRGVLMMGRFLTQETLDALAERVHVRFDLLIHDDGRLTSSEQALFSSLAFSAPRSRQEFRQGFLYQIYPDIENNPVLLLRSQTRGEIIAIGQITSNFLSVVLFLISFVLLIYLVIYRTRMKISEEALRGSEERYRTIFANKYTVMLLIDPTSAAIVDANPAACAFYGWSLEELKRMDISEINTLSKEEIIETIGLVCSGNRNRFVFKHRKVDGTICDVEVYSDPLTINGEVLLYSIVHDITERKRAEENRLNLERQLRQAQKVESLGRMAGAIAHHNNNLLGAVMGNLELAMENLPDTAGKLPAAMSAASRASEIGKLMLAYLGQTGARKEPLDLAEVCRQCLPDLRAGMPEHIAVEPVLPALGPVVSANAAQIMQIVSNLVTNAQEGMGNRLGMISLNVQTVSSAEIPAAHHFPAEFQFGTVDYACLEVRDAGSGIAESDFDKIFDPFFSTRFTGRGLGLPVVLGVVKAHDGCVMVESKPDQGTISRVFLPLSAEPLPKFKTQGPETTATLEAGTVLVVDDEPITCDMAAAMLTHMGMTVLKASDGLEAIEVFRQYEGTICCVLCDLTMPRMDGWETLTALRQLAPGIPFILSSAYDQAQVMGGDHSEWPQIFLPKPYEIAKLKKALIKAMERESGEKRWKPEVCTLN